VTIIEDSSAASHSTLYLVTPIQSREADSELVEDSVELLVRTHLWEESTVTPRLTFVARGHYPEDRPRCTSRHVVPAGHRVDGSGNYRVLPRVSHEPSRIVPDPRSFGGRSESPSDVLPTGAKNSAQKERRECIAITV
jgi:hypothetical protein